LSSIGSTIVQQFGKPSGPLGVLAGLIMRMRASNRVRNLRTVELLEIQPADRVLEVGFGPGLAVVVLQNSLPPARWLASTTRS